MLLNPPINLFHASHMGGYDALSKVISLINKSFANPIQSDNNSFALHMMFESNSLVNDSGASEHDG